MAAKRVSILVGDNIVIIARDDLAELKAKNIHAVQWHGTYGEIEFLPDDPAVSQDRKPNERIESFGQFQKYVDIK